MTTATRRQPDCKRPLGQQPSPGQAQNNTEACEMVSRMLEAGMTSESLSELYDKVSWLWSHRGFANIVAHIAERRIAQEFPPGDFR
jgi:hypothetical protein